MLTNTYAQPATNVVVGGSLPATSLITSDGICTYSGNTISARLHYSVAPADGSTIRPACR